MLRSFVTSVVLALTATQMAIADRQVAVILDVSGSMEGQKLEALKEGVKLAMALLDGEIVLIRFATDAVASGPQPLHSRDDRRAAMREVDRLVAGGDTNYPAAISQLCHLPNGTTAIFVSDGENTNGTPESVLELLKNAPGRIYSVGVDASDAAEHLLTKMAAATGGSAVSVHDPEGLTKAILEIAQRLGRYHAHTPTEEILRFPDCRGQVIALGYDAVPSMLGSPGFTDPPFQHRAKLRPEHVVLSRVQLTAPSDIEIRLLHKQTPGGRLARVLRSDLLRPVLRLPTTNGTVPAGSSIEATTEFFDSEGNQVDPRGRPELQTEYALQDQQGNTLLTRPALPSRDEPALTATLPLPKQQGPFTVIQFTEDTTAGVPFIAEDQQTIVAIDPVQLAAAPAVIDHEVKLGEFTVTLTVETDASDSTASIEYNGELAEQPNGLHLLSSQSNGKVLTLLLRAERVGTYTGSLFIHGNAAIPVASLNVPYTLRVRPRLAGLKLPASHDVHTGSQLANSGTRIVATWSVPSLDVESVAYFVQVSDLASGTALLPLTVKPASISPMIGAPTTIELSAMIGNVPSGDYHGTVDFRPHDSSDKRRWTVNMEVKVTEPITVQPLDFGKVAVGSTANRRLIVRNASAPLRGVRFSLGPFQSQGKRLTATDVEVLMPNEIPLLPGMRETPIDISVTVAPAVGRCGLYQATLSVARTASQRIEVPVRLEIVDHGDGPSDLHVSPESLRLEAVANEVLQFPIRIKLSNPSGNPSDLSAKSAPFHDSTNQAIPVAVDFVFASGSTVAHGKPVALDVFLIAPPQSGQYTGGLVFESSRGEAKLVPVILEVRRSP